MSGRMISVRAIIAALRRKSANRNAPHMADRDDVRYCYRLLLGREPEPADWDFYSPVLQRGILVRSLVDGFLASEEYARRSAEPPSYVTTDYGFGIYVYAQDRDIGAAIVSEQMYEPHVTTALRRELRPTSVFLDIGANVGWFSLLAAKLLSEGQVLAVEPNPKNLQLLYASICRNKVGNVHVFPYAASDEATLMGIQSVGSNGYVTGPSVECYGRTYVQSVRLDDLLGNESRLDVIKMDIEGHEPVALRGMTALLARHHPIIFTEFHPKAMRDNFGYDGRRYLQALVSRGYQLAVINMDGCETEPLTAADVLELWRGHNAAVGSSDEVHIDLLCRPV